MITEEKTQVVSTNYTPPVYRKIVAESLFIKIYSDTMAVLVSTAEDDAFIKQEPYPNPRFQYIADTAASDETEYETARDDTSTILLAL